MTGLWRRSTGVALMLALLMALLSALAAPAAGTPPGSAATDNYLPIIAAPFRGGPDGCAVAIMPLGDSITHGYGSATMVGYRRPLFAALAAAGYRVNFAGRRAAGAWLDFDRDNEGHPGKDAPFLRDQMAGILAQNSPDIILLHIGTNGMWQSAEAAAADADALLSAIYAIDRDVVIILARIVNRTGPPELVARTSHYNGLLQAIADRRIAAGDPLVVVDMERALLYTAAGGDMYDSLHPNDAGYGKMAAVWEAALRPILASHCQTPHAPRLTSAPTTAAIAQRPYVYRAEATGNPAPAFALEQAPAGMAIDPATGLITWTPPATGEYAVTVRAGNGQQPPASQSFVIHVAQAGVCPAETNVFYRFEEPSPPFADARGGPPARCMNCPASGNGRVGWGLQFDGLDDGLTVADDGRFDWSGGDAFTVEFWLRRPGGCGGATFGHNEVAVGRFDAASGMAWWVGVSCEHGGRARFILRDGDGGTDLADAVARTALTGGQWHHVVAVRDPALLDTRLYVDGALEGVAPAYFSSGFASDAALNAGWLDLLDGFHLTGTLDEVAIYDRALTDDEIRYHHAAGALGQPYCSLE